MELMYKEDSLTCTRVCLVSLMAEGASISAPGFKSKQITGQRQAKCFIYSQRGSTPPLPSITDAKQAADSGVNFHNEISYERTAVKTALEPFQSELHVNTRLCLFTSF